MVKTVKISEKNKDFFEQVYEVVRLIPKGRVSSYGAIARYLGVARSARMVGWAMNASNKADLEVPAHRVVNRSGLLTGKHHFSDPFEMQRRLEAEGVEVENDKVLRFSELNWEPQIEIGID